MKHVCLNCESAEMTHAARNVVVAHHGFQTTLHKLRGWHCQNCGEIEFDRGEGLRYSKAVEQLEAEERAWRRAHGRS